jgi:DNA-binding NtrC family response regulator
MNEPSALRFLVIDEQPAVRRLCLQIAATLGFSGWEAEDPERALALVYSDAPDVVLAERRFSRQSGPELLQRIKTTVPGAEVAIMTADASASDALEIIRMGAYGYLKKPLAAEEVKVVLERMAEKVRLTAERDRLRARVLELESWMAGVRALTTSDGRQPEPLPAQAPTDLEHLERITIQRVLQQVQGDKVLARKMLGISRATLYRKLRRYNIAVVAGAAAGGNS